MRGFETPDPFSLYGDYYEDGIKQNDFSQYFPTSSIYSDVSQYPTYPYDSYQFSHTSPKYSPPADFESYAAHGGRQAETEAPERPLVNLIGESIVKQTDFSLSLAKHVISTTEAKDNNFVFSPLSMHVVMSMVAAGSSGPTRAQLLGYLKSSSVEELNSLSSHVSTPLFADGGPLGGPRLSFANGIWVDKSLTTFKLAFKEIVDKDYKATSSDQVDFLNKAIEGLLGPDSVDTNTRLILANTLYFKGSWLYKFNTNLTNDDDFFLLNGTSVRVPFMSSLKRQYVRAFSGFKVLKLPYEQGDDTRKFSMYIYLPDDSDGLQALVKKIGGLLIPGFIQNQLSGVPSLVNKLIQNKNQPALGLQALVDKFGLVPGFIQNHLPERSVMVRDFRVPKFKINYDFEASGVLQEHGLTLPFSPGGLNEMVENGEGLMVSKFFQKTCIEVNEKGCQDAAASACVFDWQESLGPEPVLDFVADHPFLFVVREDVSGGVLFVGQVINPNAG